MFAKPVMLAKIYHPIVSASFGSFPYNTVLMAADKKSSELSDKYRNCNNNHLLRFQLDLLSTYFVDDNDEKC